MSLFQRNFYQNEGSFGPLFRLLDDFDTYSRQGSADSRTGVPNWQPKFDIRETRDAYELHGELPGINKENVHIEFTEPQTVVIRGKTERTYTAGTPPAGFLEGASKRGAIAEDGEQSRHKSGTEGRRFEQATQGADTRASERDRPQAERSADQGDKSTDQAKYWLAERSVGEFSRSFNFPSQVDQDGVTANFKDGILSMMVPKVKKHESRRITIG